VTHSATYLHRFALEQVATVNAVASGGNAPLLPEEDSSAARLTSL